MELSAKWTKEMKNSARTKLSRNCSTFSVSKGPKAFWKVTKGSDYPATARTYETHRVTNTFDWRI